MEKLNAVQVAELLSEIGERLELNGESRFKYKAYYKGAQALLALPIPLDEMVEQGRLQEMPGIGSVLAEKIDTLHRTGTHKTLERLREQYPAGLLQILKVPKLRREKVIQLYEQLGISTLDELEVACRANRLGEVKGFGAALQEKILKSIQFARDVGGQMHLHVATGRAGVAVEMVKDAYPRLRDVVAAGPVRRGCEIVDRITVVARGPEDQEIPTDAATPLHISPPDSYGVTLLLETGSEKHLEQLGELASSRGLSLTEEGLRKGAEWIPCPDEAAVYSALGLPYIEPELREGMGEIDTALRRNIPALVAESDIRGIIHCHTDASDGLNTLEEMAEACRAKGLQYFGVADHSQSAFYAGGLKPDRVRAQRKMVNSLNRQYESDGVPFRVFHGIESDIRPDGSLDFDEEILSLFDYVVASVHGQFAMDKESQTTRLVRAASNPFTTVLGHMTGRLLLSRPGYEVDVEKVLKACAEHGVAVEINANPHRLDVDWRWHRLGLELGCLFSINPDAHSISELDLVRWGVLQARKGWIPPDRVLNTKDLSTFTIHLTNRRSLR